MDKNDKFKRLVEFLFKSEHNTFFTKFVISDLNLEVSEATSVDDESIGYRCNLNTEYYSFNEAYELASSLNVATDILYKFFRKITPNSEGSIYNINSDEAGGRFDDDFFLGIQVESLSVDYGSEKVIVNWHITYDK